MKFFLLKKFSFSRCLQIYNMKSIETHEIIAISEPHPRSSSHLNYSPQYSCFPTSVHRRFRVVGNFQFPRGSVPLRPCARTPLATPLLTLQRVRAAAAFWRQLNVSHFYPPLISPANHARLVERGILPSQPPRPIQMSPSLHVFLCGTEWHTLKDVRSHLHPEPPRHHIQLRFRLSTGTTAHSMLGSSRSASAPLLISS